MNRLKTVDAAIELAVFAHRGQRDKSGMPYIAHPIRVMAEFDDPALQIIAVLHDVVEDCPAITLDWLTTKRWSDETVAAIDALTHRKGESNEDYYRRVKANPDALDVKLADIKDNMSWYRLAKLPEDVSDRLRSKYIQAIECLKS